MQLHLCVMLHKAQKMDGYVTLHGMPCKPHRSLERKNGLVSSGDFHEHGRVKSTLRLLEQAWQKLISGLWSNPLEEIHVTL